MFYLSQILGRTVYDRSGKSIGKLSDLAIQTGQVFPHITSITFRGPGKTPFQISWRKYVDQVDQENKVHLKVDQTDLRFSYTQPGELLVARDLLNKQIVDTAGLKVVRVNDLKFAPSGGAKGGQYRLLGAEVGIRGLLRGISPHLEGLMLALSKLFGHSIKEKLIAWSYMELVDKDLSDVRLAVSHKRLEELHPADIADILEQLDPKQRAAVFDHLDAEQAADTVTELEDEYQGDIIDELSPSQAAGVLNQMEPDDVADILGDLDYDKREALLKLMGVDDRQNVRRLLGYKEDSAGGVMTTEFLTLPKDETVQAAIEAIRAAGQELENVHYVYLVDDAQRLAGTISLRQLVVAKPDAILSDLATPVEDLITTGPERDQEEVARLISKYNLLSVPVIDEQMKLLGIVTVDDALDVIEEEHEEDLHNAGSKIIYMVIAVIVLAIIVQIILVMVH
ncbi:MAG: CBS domain-containing protein [Coriobacteriales bacterium]|jgi:CBS domain-containing protein/sporulation protein YlmC with PRC-barrel domain|nr:CBS domain-containing protein [Coriobacteriales bacterium]